MAESYTISCPSCSKKMKVGEQVIGKKIKCKDCSHIFVVAKPSSSDGHKPKAEVKAVSNLTVKERYEEEMRLEDEQGEDPYVMGQIEEGVARCPRCANAMESEEAVICLHCGFNVKTRARLESKTVYEHTGQDIFLWRLPGIACVIATIGLIVLAVLLNVKIMDWADGSFLQNEDTSNGKYWLNPKIFALYGTLALIFMGIPIVRFAIKRLVFNHRPPEKEIK